jgi:tripartite-type tricarboxylate transporter receptor subunit TctC
MWGAYLSNRMRGWVLSAALTLGVGAASAVAQDYPTRPITDIVASTPGGGTDIISRIVGEQLSTQLKQPFVVENIPGAGSLTGTVTAAKATPDGYTLTTGLTASMAVNPSLFAKLPYDPISDFEPIAMLAKFSFVLVVSNNFPAHSVKDLIALCKAKPGEINFASAGNGTGQHSSMELFQLLANVKMTHVPYRGAQPAYADRLGSDPRRHGACARRQWHPTIAAAAGRADRRRVRRAGISELCLVRALGAKKDTATDCRQAA